MRRVLMTLVLGLALLSGPSGGALAQSAEAEALGLRMSRALFQAMPLAELIEKAVADDKGSGFELASRPEWKGYLTEAMAEELRHDLPALERLVGDSLAKNFTVPELRVGAALFEDPGMQAAMRGDKTAKPSRDTERLARTPAGESLLKKMDDVDAILDPVLEQFVVELLPGAFRRFADKAEAGEARRAAAQPAVK